MTILNGITLALSKGRIFEETLPLLAAAGITPTDNPETSRKLIIGTNRPDVRLVIVRATDTPTYVQYGAADMGIAGKDVLLEHGGAGLYQPLDLNIAKCRLCVAGAQGFRLRRGGQARCAHPVATKYVKAAREHFAAKGVHVDLIKLYGSMELAPLVGWPTPSSTWCPPAARSRPTTWSRSRTSCPSAPASSSIRPPSS
jgi:ATP phosphoribosyltransferase